MIEAVKVFRLADRQSWEASLSHDCMPGHRWRYSAALATPDFQPRLAVLETVGGRLVVPYVERKFRGFVHISTLPGLSGAVAEGDADVWMKWREFATQQGWVCGYIQLAPDSLLPSNPPPEELAVRDITFLLDPGQWSLERTPSQIIRRKVRTAIQSSARITSNPAELCDAFPRLYGELMRRFGKGQRYSSAMLMHWASDPQNVLLGAAIDDEVLMVHCVLVSGIRAELHVVGSTERGRGLSALMYARAIDVLRDRGVRQYNLGAAGSEGSGLYTFKSWLGATAAPMHALQQVYDRPTFSALCRAGTDGVQNDWFPPFAAPAA